VIALSRGVATSRELADSERLRGSVLAILDEGVIVLDLQGLLAHANPAACAILDLDLASARGDPGWWESFSARRTSDGLPLNAGANVLVTGEGVRDVGVELERPDGKSVLLSVNYRPLRSDTGSVSGLVLSFSDVTARERERRSLLESQDRLREAHDVAMLASWEWNPSTDEVIIFNALAGSGSLTETQVPLEGLLALSPSEERQDLRDDLTAFVHGKRNESVRRHCQDFPAGVVWLETRSRAVRDETGELMCVRGTSQDVTEQELARQSVAQSRDFLQATLDSLVAHVAVLDEQGEIIMTNRAWVRFAADNGARAGAGEANYLAVSDAATGDECAAHAAAGLRAILDGAQSEFSLEYPCHSPTVERWFVLHATRYTGPGEARVVVTHVDVTRRVTSQRALLQARNYLRTVTDSMGEGLFAIDVEGRVTYLNEAAEKLLGWSLSEVRGRVMHYLTHKHRPDGSEMPIEECPILQALAGGETAHIDDDLFTHRDGHRLSVAYTAAPFETDDGLQGCVVVLEDISERKAREEILQHDVETLAQIQRIQDALAEERFVLYAQPIIDLHTREVVQRELLLRVREPDGSIVGPGAYLPVAEQYGLIGDIDRWVIQRGTEIAATGFPVQVNVSARSISDRNVLDHIERCIEQTGADPTLLVFEITETALVRDEAAACAFAERLHSIGCKLALDDFGTGYGGFTFLKQLPVDYLKIDVEFVSDLATNSASCHVVQAVVALARAFSLQTVGEGVEDAETLQLLQELGVDYAQGFHIARPRPLDQSPDETASGAV
jgi:PAS domain S-box-containing protein